MALNLSTPRYVAPDVTRAALAAENISASQARTNLAERSFTEQQRKSSVQERQAEAQLAMNMASQANEIAKEQAMRPYQIAQAQQNIYGQALSNMSARQKVILNEFQWPLEYEMKQAQIEKDIVDTDIARSNLSAKRAETAQAPLVNFWLREASMITARADWGTNDKLELPPIPPELTGAGLTEVINFKEAADKLAVDNGRGHEEREAKKMETAQLAYLRANQKSLPTNFDTPDVVKAVAETNKEKASAIASTMNVPVPAGDDWWKPALDTNGIIDTDTLRFMLNDRFRIKADQLESEQKRRLEENDIDLKFWDDEYKRLVRLRETKGNSDALAEILGADMPKGEATKAYGLVEDRSDKELMEMATENVIARKGAIAGGFVSPATSSATSPATSGMSAASVASSHMAAIKPIPRGTIVPAGSTVVGKGGKLMFVPTPPAKTP
tara:strand:- start:123 stop:1448 length:1326 start_codon:yes stop_codon:yes gene_type:complete